MTHIVQICFNQTRTETHLFKGGTPLSRITVAHANLPLPLYPPPPCIFDTPRRAFRAQVERSLVQFVLLLRRRNCYLTGQVQGLRRRNRCVTGLGHNDTLRAIESHPARGDAPDLGPHGEVAQILTGAASVLTRSIHLPVVTPCALATRRIF